MLSKIENILLLFRDMQEMVNPDDDLSRSISSIRKRSIELNEAELDLISAAGDPSAANKIDTDED